MAIMTHPAPRSDGTIFGVPFRFHIERYKYELPDGKEFDYEEYDAMTEYVMQNLSSFEAAVLGEVNKKIKPEPASIVDIEQMVNRASQSQHDRRSRERANARYQIEQENKKIQLKWDKDFNRRVLDIVRRCVEEGTVHVAMMTGLGLASYDKPVSIGDKIEHHTIVYPRHMTAAAAYMNVREQVEKVVKTTMEPPRLHKIPVYPPLPVSP